MLNKIRLYVILTITILILSILPGWTEAAFTLSDDASEAASNKPYLGNVSKDDTINVGDAITILRHIVGLTELDADSRQRADVNLDGEIAVSDAIQVLRYIVGLIPEFTTADPAVVSTEQALNHVIHKTGAATVILAGNINLAKELEITRNITVKGPENGAPKTILGTVNLSAETTGFTAQNLIIDGSLTVDTGGKIHIDLSHNCDIYQAVFLSGEATVTGGKNIRSAWIAAHATVTFDDPPPTEEPISTEKSSLQKTTPKTVTAGEDNIELLITLKDFTGSPLSDHFNVTVEHESEIWFGEEVKFDEEGRVVLSLTVTKTGQYNAVAVQVKDITMGTFDVKVEPAGIDASASQISYDPLVKAGRNNITLQITLKDEFRNPVTGDKSTVAELNYAQKIGTLTYSPEGTAAITLEETEAGEHTGTVTVADTHLGEFTITVEPADAAKLAVAQEPAGSRDGSGETGEVIIVTRDQWGNDSASGLGKYVYIETSLSDERYRFTGESVTRKNIGTGGVSPGEVKFDRLQIDTETSLFDQTMVFKSLDPAFAEEDLTTQPFHVTGFTAISGEQSEIISHPAEVTAGEKNIQLTLTLYDPDGNSLSGNFLTTVGDGWFEEPVHFNGRTDFSFTQTAAGNYTDIPVLVDGTEIGTFDLTVEPAAPEKIKFATDPEEDIIIGQAETPLDITVIARDIYGNHCPGEEIYVYCIYGEKGILREPEEREFDGGTLSQTTGNSGEAAFQDLIIDDTGNYIIFFTFREVDFANIEEMPPLWHNYLIIPHPEESLTYWDGYYAPLQSEINTPVEIMAAPRDENGEKITGLQKANFTLEAHYRDNGASGDLPAPVRGSLTINSVEEIFPGFYNIEFRYNEDTKDPLEIKVTVLYGEEPLHKKIPLNLEPE